MSLPILGTIGKALGALTRVVKPVAKTAGTVAFENVERVAAGTVASGVAITGAEAVGKGMQTGLAEAAKAAIDTQSPAKTVAGELQREVSQLGAPAALHDLATGTFTHGAEIATASVSPEETATAFLNRLIKNQELLTEVAARMQANQETVAKILIDVEQLLAANQPVTLTRKEAAMLIGAVVLASEVEVLTDENNTRNR